MNVQRLVGLAALLLIALNMLVGAEAYAVRQWGERAFQPGPRYGRGGAKKLATLRGTPTAMRSMLAPRIERFELGTRYGKRSSSDEASEALPAAATTTTTPAKTLLCRHTGVADIYRCNQSFGGRQDAEE